ncbi:MAG: 8-oxoguanine deaminase [Candidatus Dormibacteraceae bacterium]
MHRLRAHLRGRPKSRCRAAERPMKLAIRAGLLVTGRGEQLSQGWLLSRDGAIIEVGSGPLPAADEFLDLPNCVAVPGLVNAHDHLYQWATRGFNYGDGLFGWLRALYPIWAEMDADVVRAAARAGIGRLLLSGCTLTADHHYIFPKGRPGIFEALVDAAAGLGIRFQPCRGSMSLGQSDGGLPPDSLVEDDDEILAECERLVAKFHDPDPGSMCRVSIAPCSPFSVTQRQMREAATLARKLGVRLHTHLAETAEEDEYCVDKFGKRPLDLLEELGWLDSNVWLAHGVHFSSAEVRRLGEHGTGIAHCPSSNMRLGAGACPVADLLAAGVPVGLGVDGAASNEDYHLVGEVRQALLLGRLRASMLGAADPAAAMDPVTAWRLATAGGAAVLGRLDCGTIEVGKRADVALFRADDLGRAGIPDPFVALALAPPARAEAVVVEGRIVVRGGRLVNADEDQLAVAVAAASRQLLGAHHA